jgi:hypothetical protein
LKEKGLQPIAIQTRACMRGWYDVTISRTSRLLFQSK